MEQQQSSTIATPQGDGDSRPFDVASEPDEVTFGRELHEVIDQLRSVGLPSQMVTQRQTLTLVGDLLRALDRKVLRDVLPAWARVTAVGGARVIAEDWTGGRARFADQKDRDKAWARLSGLVAIAIANAESLDAHVHWRLASSFLRYLALLEYHNAVTALNHQRDLGLTLEQVTSTTNDVNFLGRYAGVL